MAEGEIHSPQGFTQLKQRKNNSDFLSTVFYPQLDNNISNQI